MRRVLVCRESRVRRWKPHRHDIYNIMHKYKVHGNEHYEVLANLNN